MSSSAKHVVYAVVQSLIPLLQMPDNVAGTVAPFTLTHVTYSSPDLKSPRKAALSVSPDTCGGTLNVTEQPHPVLEHVHDFLTEVSADSITTVSPALQVPRQAAVSFAWPTRSARPSLPTLEHGPWRLPSPGHQYPAVQAASTPLHDDVSPTT